MCLNFSTVTILFCGVRNKKIKIDAPEKHFPTTCLVVVAVVVVVVVSHTRVYRYNTHPCHALLAAAVFCGSAGCNMDLVANVSFCDTRWAIMLDRLHTYSLVLSWSSGLSTCS